jgi:hypothetical protein
MFGTFISDANTKDEENEDAKFLEETCSKKDNI